MLEIKDKFELIALHRVIVEAKFSNDVIDSAIVTSSLVAELSNKVISEAMEAMDSKEAKEWESWLYIEQDSRHYEILLSRIREFDSWNELKKEELLDFINLLASPLRLSENLANQLVNLGDSHWKK